MNVIYLPPALIQSFTMFGLGTVDENFPPLEDTIVPRPLLESYNCVH